MADRILGIDQEKFYALLIILLLIILGIVSFHYYAYVFANNGIGFGTGIGFSILQNRNNTPQQILPEAAYRY